MRSWAAVIASPTICVGLLAGILTEQRYRLTPTDAEPYHKRAADGIMNVPPILGAWLGKDIPPSAAAVKLLRSNVIMQRRYTDFSANYYGRRTAELLIVHCSDSRDMVGHYPPICYRASGMTKSFEAQRDWTFDGVTIKGMEYQFVKSTYDQTIRNCVYNFMIVPGKDGGTICRDMNGVMDAAESYQQRYYGATQFQVLMSADLPEQQREEMFEAMIRPNLRLIQSLLQTSTPVKSQGQP